MPYTTGGQRQCTTKAENAQDHTCNLSFASAKPAQDVYLVILLRMLETAFLEWFTPPSLPVLSPLREWYDTLCLFVLFSVPTVNDIP